MFGREKSQTQNVAFGANDSHYINDENVPIASEHRAKCSNFPLWGRVQPAQTASPLTALVKLEPSTFNQVVFTVWLVCYRYLPAISVNGSALRGHAPPLPIDSGSVSYGHKVTKTGFAHQYETWHNTQQMWSAECCTKQHRHTHWSGIDSNISTLSNRLACLLWLRLPLNRPDSRCMRLRAGRPPPGNINSAACLFSYLALNYCHWAPLPVELGDLLQDLRLFYVSCLEKKNLSLVPYTYCPHFPRLYPSSGSLCTTAYHKDILWCRFS